MCVECSGRPVLERMEKQMQAYVTIRGVISPSAERPRFPGQCQSPRGQSGPKAKPNGEADGRTVNIPSLSCGAMRGRRSDTAAGKRNFPLKGVG